MDIVGFPFQLLPSHLCRLPCSATLTMETRGRGCNGHTIYVECQSDTVKAKSRNGLNTADQKNLISNFSVCTFKQVWLLQNCYYLFLNPLNTWNGIRSTFNLQTYKKRYFWVKQCRAGLNCAHWDLVSLWKLLYNIFFPSQTDFNRSTKKWRKLLNFNKI